MDKIFHIRMDTLVIDTGITEAVGNAVHAIFVVRDRSCESTARLHLREVDLSSPHVYADMPMPLGEIIGGGLPCTYHHSCDPR